MLLQVREFLFLICVKKTTSSLKNLVLRVRNSSRHRNCFTGGYIHSLFVSKALTRSYLARSSCYTNNSKIQPRTPDFLWRELYLCRGLFSLTTNASSRVNLRKSKYCSELISIKLLGFFLDYNEYFYKIELSERHHQLMKSVHHLRRYFKFPNARIVYHHPKILKLPREFSCSFNIYNITQKNRNKIVFSFPSFIFGDFLHADRT